MFPFRQIRSVGAATIFLRCFRNEEDPNQCRWESYNRRQPKNPRPFRKLEKCGTNIEPNSYAPLLG